MLYINQLDHPEIPYHTDAEHGSPRSDESIKTSGCGICCACMLADRLGMQTLTLEESIALSYETGANHERGTDMKILGAALAERFGWSLEMTDEITALEACLRAGGCAIINVGGDREGHTGIFSHGGHYILSIAAADDRFAILDPSWTSVKYNGTNVLEDSRILWATAEDLLADTANRSPGFYLFNRKIPNHEA